MSPATDKPSEPLALLVEDDPQSLKIRREMLNDVGFATVAVQNEQDALREFVASPGVDLVITDIRLHPKRPRDKSGVNLAKKLKVIRNVSRMDPRSELVRCDTAVVTDRTQRAGLPVRA